ncbi:hypothetical protein A9R10_20895 [Aeromonas piscicola]|nr:hypothetical protein A9R10_20895 [Aeromonas piscicola]
MEMTRPCQQGKSHSETVCLLYEQLVLKLPPQRLNQAIEGPCQGPFLRPFQPTMQTAALEAAVCISDERISG